ncbi:MAG TPA: lanthionine synthetase C family protein [Enhygromyxa sp.]|nr:lanthionine synthetase C family protein [Enhygromyxa sp.]
MSWQPILVGAEADHAREIVATIAAELCAHVEAVGLDEPWMALLFSDRARVDGREQDARVAAWMEALAIDELAESALDPILHNGWVGTAFVLAQLAEQRGESADDERFAEIDAALLDELHGDHWYGRHDLIEGLAGIASYALERLPSPIAARCLTCVVEHLAATAETREVGLCWRTPGRHWPDLDQPARDDLGVAHGIAGVITVLARAHAAGIEPERCRALVEGAVAWLIAQRLPVGVGSRVPHWIEPDREPREARQAWCYGGLGIAPTLVTAARCLGRPEWEATARAWALAEAERAPEQTGIIDPYFCHGSIGAAHLFNRLYQATGEPRLRSAAQTWLRRTFAYFDPNVEGAIAGFRPQRMPGREPDGEWMQCRGLLTGVTGTGLGLLAATGEVAPAWDRGLGAGIPDRP